MHKSTVIALILLIAVFVSGSDASLERARTKLQKIINEYPQLAQEVKNGLIIPISYDPIPWNMGRMF